MTLEEGLGELRLQLHLTPTKISFVGEISKSATVCDLKHCHGIA